MRGRQGVVRSRHVDKREAVVCAEVFTGKQGKVTPIAETIRSFEELCDGKHDDLREDAFMYVGGIDEAVEQGKRLTAEGK